LRRRAAHGFRSGSYGRLFLREIPGNGREQRSYETVSAARQRLDVNGLLCGVGQRVTKFVDGLVEAVLKVDERFLRPQTMLDFFPGNNLAGALQEH
jgi:hypothetical protein